MTTKVPAGLLESQSFDWRNRLINGDMRVDTRNAGASQTVTAAAALAYSVDRWYAYCTGANVTGQRIAGSGATQNRYQFTGAGSVTGIGFGQRIEASNSFDLAGSQVVVSVDLSNSLLTTVSWALYYANTADTFGTLASPTRTSISSGTFTVTSSVARYSTAAITLPAGATTGLELVLSVGAQTSGTWVIGNVQLELGTTASTYQKVEIGEQTRRCARYYQALNNYIGAHLAATTLFAVTMPFPVAMRAAPTLGDLSLSQSFVTTYAKTATATTYTITLTGAGNAGSPAYTTNSSTLTASAEL